jgi:prepilin-type processing-associated H-X9-DG protein
MNQYIRAGFSGEANFNESYPGYNTGMILGFCPRPSRVILLYEGVQDKDGYCSRLGSPFYLNGANALRPSANSAFAAMKYANLPQNYHNGKSNFLFLDGHVKLMAPASTLDVNSYHSGVKDIRYWQQIYKSCGSEDYWNPRVSGVNYP